MGTSSALPGAGVLVLAFTYCLRGVFSRFVAMIFVGVLVPVETTTGCAMYVAFSMVATKVYVPDCLVSLATVSVSMFFRSTVGVLVPLSLQGGAVISPPERTVAAPEVAMTSSSVMVT